MNAVKGFLYEDPIIFFQGLLLWHSNIVPQVVLRIGVLVGIILVLLHTNHQDQYHRV